MKKVYTIKFIKEVLKLTTTATSVKDTDGYYYVCLDCIDEWFANQRGVARLGNLHLLESRHAPCR